MFDRDFKRIFFSFIEILLWDLKVFYVIFSLGFYDIFFYLHVLLTFFMRRKQQHHQQQQQRTRIKISNNISIKTNKN